MTVHYNTYMQCIKYIHTCMHTYIPTYLHTYIPTYLHTYIHTYIHRKYAYIYIHVYGPGQQPSPLPHVMIMVLYIRCTYAVFRGLYVRYFTHTTPLCDGWGLGSVSLACKVKRRQYVATILHAPPHEMGRC